MAKNKANGNGKAKSKARGRKSKAESMTGTKANEVEMRKVSPQFQLAVIEEKPGDFRSYFDRARSNYEIYTKHQGRYREVIKEAKERNPLLAEAVKLAIATVDEDGGIDHDAIAKKLQVQGFVLKEFGSSLQLTLHDTSLGDENDLAYARGFETGEAGKALDAPYPPHSDLAEIHALGWRNGQNKLMNLPYGTSRATAIERIEPDAVPDLQTEDDVLLAGPDEEDEDDGDSHDGDAPVPIKEPEPEFA